MTAGARINENRIEGPSRYGENMRPPASLAELLSSPWHALH